MYGLVLYNVQQYIQTNKGEEAWRDIVRHAELNTYNFAYHDIYGEVVLHKLVDAASEVMGMPQAELMFEVGASFVRFMREIGYEGVLKVLGRDFKSFINGLDSIHEHLKSTYPKIKAPSFFCVNESKTGITLQYRSRRDGLANYVRGQLWEVAQSYYNINPTIEVINHYQSDESFVTVLRVHFDNKDFQRRDSNGKPIKDDSDDLPVPSIVFFQVFPFHLVFNRGLKVQNAGSGILSALPNVEGTNIRDVFHLYRPCTDFTWDSVMMHLNNAFELIAIANLKESEMNELQTIQKQEMEAQKDLIKKRSSTLALSHALTLRGQMKYMTDWDAIIFLGVPILRDISSMESCGLYLNDLSMHDSSRDLVLSGEQQSAELKSALEQEHVRNEQLAKSLKELDEEKHKTDELLYQMIPRAVANKLRRGEDVLSTCQTFDEVTILFSDVVGFTEICSRISPLGVVTMLNTMYQKFDALSERNCVYKVETIGDAYMVVAGAPIPTPFHAVYICEMALDMVQAITSIADPSRPMDHLNIRVGAHTGKVVAGVVGQKMPRYCLFGDTVNTASRMESTSEPQKIHISETTCRKISGHPFIYRERSTVEIKGKGTMKTFWMDGHSCSESDSALVAMRALLVEDKAAMVRLSEAALTAARRPRSSSRRTSEERRTPRTVLPPLSGPTPLRK